MELNYHWKQSRVFMEDARRYLEEECFSIQWSIVSLFYAYTHACQALLIAKNTGRIPKSHRQREGLVKKKLEVDYPGIADAFSMLLEKSMEARYKPEISLDWTDEREKYVLYIVTKLDFLRDIVGKSNTNKIGE